MHFDLQISRICLKFVFVLTTFFQMFLCRLFKCLYSCLHTNTRPEVDKGRGTVAIYHLSCCSLLCTAPNHDMWNGASSGTDRITKWWIVTDWFVASSLGLQPLTAIPILFFWGGPEVTIFRREVGAGETILFGSELETMNTLVVKPVCWPLERTQF